METASLDEGPVGRATPFTDLLNHMTPFIRWHARRLAPDDRDLQEDLTQEGRIALWRLDPVRLAAARHADRYQRAAIRFRMLRYLVAQRRWMPKGRPISWAVVEQVIEELGGRAA